MIAALSTIDLFCIWAVAIAFVYDFAVWCQRGLEGTVSRRIIQLSRRYQAIPFALGLLAGYWFAN